MEKDNVLLKAKNIIITPHIAWAPIEARTRLIKIVSKKFAKMGCRNPYKCYRIALRKVFRNGLMLI